MQGFGASLSRAHTVIALPRARALACESAEGPSAGTTERHRGRFTSSRSGAVPFAVLANELSKSQLGKARRSAGAP